MQLLKLQVKKVIATITLVFFCLVSFSQADMDIQSIKTSFNIYQQKNLQEKIYVHTDNTFYLAGEILWFKIYSVDDTYNIPLDISKVAYVEILDKTNRQIISTKISMQDGSGNGSIYLPSSINTGNYRLRAYTNWMKNYRAELFFEKDFTIFNTITRTAQPTSIARPVSYSIKFYPEGGNLVNTLSGKIAFQVLDDQGKGINCQGIILDKKDTVAHIKTLKFGIGSFDFTPQYNKEYVARLKLPDGTYLTGILPASQQNGITQHVSDINTSVHVKVMSSEAGNQNVYLLIHAGQQILVAEKGLISNGLVEFLIDKSKLAEGISTITVFNSARQAVCERLYYKSTPNRLIKSDIKPDQLKYDIRKKVTLDIHIPLEKEEIADLSASVFISDSLSRDHNASISEYLELSSHLKGKIESPGYYLHSTEEEVKEAMDNLLLTHGWRKYIWEDILKGKTEMPKFFPEYNGHIVSALVTDKNSKQPCSNITSYLSVPGKKIQLFIGKSNNKGEVLFETKDIRGTNELVIQTNVSIDSSYRIEPISPFSTEFTASVDHTVNINKIMADKLYHRNIYLQAKNIYDGQKLWQFKHSVSDSTFYGQPTKRYLLDNYTRFKTMEEVLREYVVEVGVSLQKKNYDLKVLDFTRKSFFQAEPLILLDGVPVFTKNKIINYDPLKVKSIEAVIDQYFLGPAYFEGIINFSTYNSDLSGYEPDLSATIINYEGLQLQREFYSPQYNSDEQAQSTIPDFRDVLYWNPNVKLDPAKKQLDFFTSDQKGIYRITLQGITTKGRKIYQTSTFEVAN